MSSPSCEFLRHPVPQVVGAWSTRRPWIPSERSRASGGKENLKAESIDLAEGQHRVDCGLQPVEEFGLGAGQRRAAGPMSSVIPSSSISRWS